MKIENIINVITVVIWLDILEMSSIRQQMSDNTQV